VAFLVFSNPHAGDFPGYLSVVNDRTDRIIFYSYLRPTPTFEVDGAICTGRAAIRCSFPEEGRYTVQVWFFQELGLDVLKGEMPFSIVTEEAYQ
jgi:hypothetical protein